MKKNLNFKLITWVLVGAFMMQTSGSLWAVNPIPYLTAQTRANLLTRYYKDSKLKRIVDKYRETKELRHKKKAGTATKQELRELERKMKRIKIAATAIGVTLAVIATIAAIIGGTTYYVLSQDSVEYGEIPYQAKEAEPAKRKKRRKKSATRARENEETERLKKQEEMIEEFEKEKEEMERRKQLSLYELISEGLLSTAERRLAKEAANPDSYESNLSYHFADTDEIIESFQKAVNTKAKYWNITLIRLLLQKGKNKPDLRSMQHQIILRYMKKAPGFALGAILDKLELPIDLVDKETGDTLLILIVKNKNSNFLHLAQLVTQGADITIKNNDGKTALDIAKEMNRPLMIRILSPEESEMPPPKVITEREIEITEAAKEMLPHLAKKPKSVFVWFEILNVEENASCKSIKKQYLKLALTVHPDKNPDKKQAANEAFKAIGTAYDQSGCE